MLNLIICLIKLFASFNIIMILSQLFWGLLYCFSCDRMYANTLKAEIEEIYFCAQVVFFLVLVIVLIN